MSEDSWDGRNLRVVYAYMPPYTIPYNDSTGKLRISGYLGSLLGNITESLNITYTLQMPQDGFYGHADEKTGELHGAVRDVAEGNADLAIGPIHALQEMYDQLHELPRVKEGFSRTVFVFGVEHEYVSRTPAFTEAVHFDVWLGLLACASALIMLVMIRHGYMFRSPNISLFFTLIQWSFTFFGILLQEATSSRPPTLWFHRLLRGIWMFGCMLFSYIFLGNLRANLVVLTPTERINTIEQFLERSIGKIYYGDGTPAPWVIATYPGANGDRLREYFKRNGVGVAPFADLFKTSAMEQMVRSKGCTFFEERVLLVAVSEWCMSSDYVFHVMQQEVSPIAGTMYSSRNLPSDLSRSLDRKISWLQSFAVPFLKSREVWPGNLDCIAGTEKKLSESVRTVVIDDLNTIFVSLLVGQIVSTIVFVFELLYQRIYLYLYKKPNPNSL